ncbi:hypothetical protein [Anatilimnocola floriformis]|uniref:hypothetical protein n=1 Tax=Anatilimnocola floriformis TaxID=2948575 RepID=UPI0020C370E9|nr:hypothetical protein [Anatilimnocola floriformis]
MNQPHFNPRARGEGRCKFAGCLEYVLEDEDFAPHGRNLELRVHYSWNDYDPTDDPHAPWGPTIEAVDIVAVNHFDAAGNEIPADGLEVSKEMAWELVEADAERVLEACREDGYRTGAGESPEWYYPAKQASSRIAPRLSRSIPTRQANRQQFG